MSDAPAPTRSVQQQRRAQREKRRAKTAALAGGSATEVLDIRPRLSHQAATVQRAFPPALVERGVIVRQTGQANRGHFPPELFAANPQHGRVVSRIVDQLAKSFDANGQQEPILARLVTDADRELWPTAVKEKQLFFIIDGHQRFAAVGPSSLDRIWAEIVLPEEGESDVVYRRRCLTMASIKMMQSQAYDIFDKVNQVKIWMTEFGVPELPSKRDLSNTFQISPTEAHRIRTVTRLAPAVEQRIRDAENKPADEVVAMIAAYPPEQQMVAYERLGSLPVTQARAVLKDERRSAGTASMAGRPHNDVYRPRDPECDIVAIITRLTPEQWKAEGGTRHFWESVQKIGHSREHQDRLKEDID